MKKFNEFILRLKPYRRKYRMFCIGIFLICAFVFLQLMLILSEIVPHNFGGYHFFFNGFHSIASGYGDETNACLGFVIPGVVLGYIPFLVMLIPFYFISANFVIFEKLSERFQNTSAAKYRRWASIVHFGEIAVVSLVITGIVLLSGGYNPFHTLSVATAIPTAFEDGAGRMVGISAFLHFGIGYIFALIDIFWLLGLAIGWVFKQIARFFRYIGKMIEDSKRRRMEEKLARKEAKAASKK
jgi:hypothetical protein